MKNNSVLTALVRKFPKAFKKRPGNWRPLQRDIETSLAILAPEIPSQEIEMDGFSTSASVPIPKNDDTTLLAEITVFAAKYRLSKRLALEDGSLVSRPSPKMTSGRAIRVRISGAADLAKVIETPHNNKMLTLGRMTDNRGDIVDVLTKEEMASSKSTTTAIARTRKYLKYPPGKMGVVLLDFDTDGMPPELRGRDYWEMICDVVPGLRNAERLVRASTSAGLYRTDTGGKTPGSDGLHVYVFIKDASDTRRFLNALHIRAWLKGCGWMKLSAIGVPLERSIVDRAIWGPEQSIYEADPELEPPLAQDKEARRPIAIEGEVIDSRALCPDPTPAEQEAYQRLVDEARAKLQPEISRIIEERAIELAARTGRALADARTAIEFRRHRFLLPEDVIEFDRLGPHTVAEVYSDLARFNEQKCADPQKRGRRTQAMLIVTNGVPWIKSYASGGTKYTLLRDTAPTYPGGSEMDIETARAALRKYIGRFLDRASRGLPTKQALMASTGLSKTQIAASSLPEFINARRLDRVGYSVPTHRLGESVAEMLRAGISAEVWQGRHRPGMCDNLEAVRAAEGAGLPVETSACRGKNPAGEVVECPFYRTCRYQKQKSKRPQAWIFPHQMLFQKQEAIGTLSALFIDERFIDAGLWSMRMSLDEVGDAPPGKNLCEEHALAPLRRKLERALRRQSEPGPVRRANLVAEGLTVEECVTASRMEWEATRLWPGMSAEALSGAKGRGKYTRQMTRIWREARRLLENPRPDAVSGRLLLHSEKTESGLVRMVLTQGKLRITRALQDVPTLAMDATRPSASILERWLPDVEMLPAIEAAMPPWVYIRQVLGAPISKRKRGAASIRALRRYVLRRWYETGCGEALVVAQEATESLLRDLGLPAGIHIEHFNNIAGLDQYRHVRLLIIIGRTQPEPELMERQAAAITGEMPEQVMRPWYGRTPRIIRLAPLRGRAPAPRTLRGDAVRGEPKGYRQDSGTPPLGYPPPFLGYPVRCDVHPEALVEALRWQACEAEIIQAIGRGRGINREKDRPLDVDVLANVCLPLTVNHVEAWEAPGREAELLAGIWPKSPRDLARAWPDLFPSVQAAKVWLGRNRRGPLDYPLHGNMRLGGYIAKSVLPKSDYPLHGSLVYYRLPGKWQAKRSVAACLLWNQSRACNG
jgi:hypothetical protein